MMKMGLCNHEFDGDHTVTGFCPTCESKMFGTLVPLTGSDKQITWATDIRINQLRELGKSVLRRAKSVDNIPAPGLAALAKLAAISEAKFWIDNQASDANMLLKAALK
jgi:hypothetical protein